METQQTPRQFVVIFVLGAPGAGKGTLCSHLSQAHNLTHYSVGDGLRDWMREHRGEPLALQIQDKLDNQGFLAPDDLNPFILQEIKNAVQSGMNGILVDGFPRSTEQLQTFAQWPFQDALPLASSSGGAVNAYAKPDVVLSFSVAKHNARARYLGRARDSNDSKEKFERRFAEYERETLAVEDVYRNRGVLVDIDVNGTKEENVNNMTAALLKNDLWQKTVIGGSAETHFLV